MKKKILLIPGIQLSNEFLQNDVWDYDVSVYFSNQPLTEDKLCKLIKGKDGVVAGTEQYTSRVLESAGNLKVISRIGAGFDNINFNACKEKGIQTTFTPHAPTQSVAEITICQILNVLRNVTRSNCKTHKKKWEKYLGRRIADVTIGILGFGRIGKRVASMLKPFQPDIIYNNKEKVFKYCEETAVSTDYLFENSDIVSVHIPLNKDNYHFVNARLLDKMKKNAFLINFSRGGVIDEHALLKKLAGKAIAGACLDVFENEPYSGNLLNFPNVFVTPHIGANTVYSRNDMIESAVSDCIKVLEGESPKYPINKYHKV